VKSSSVAREATMSSFDFEPLFVQQPQTTASVVALPEDRWVPTQIEREPESFEPTFDDSAPAVVSVESVRDELLTHMAAMERAHQVALQDAFDRGVSEGREAGESAERARLRGAMIAAESAFDDLRAGESRWLANVEENVAAIAVAIAQQIIVREVTTAPEVVLSLVTRAVQEFALDQALSIRVNPGDLENLQAADRHTPGDYGELSTTREIRWVADARIEHGGCVVEGRERIIDGRVDTSLERLYRRLTRTNA
jgi:flagellar assembly protein FliH